MSDPIRLLVVEDSEDDYLLLKRLLARSGRSYQTFRVDSEQALREALGASWAAVISDYNIFGFTGLRALAIIREREPDLPFILMSGSIGEAKVAEAIQAGAQDYVMKGQAERLLEVLARVLEAAARRRAGPG